MIDALSTCFEVVAKIQQRGFFYQSQLVALRFCLTCWSTIQPSIPWQASYSLWRTDAKICYLLLQIRYNKYLINWQTVSFDLQPSIMLLQEPLMHDHSSWCLGRHAPHLGSNPKFEKPSGREFAGEVKQNFLRAGSWSHGQTAALQWRPYLHHIFYFLWMLWCWHLRISLLAFSLWYK